MGKVKFPSGSSGCELAFRLIEDVTWVKFLAHGKDWGSCLYDGYQAEADPLRCCLDPYVSHSYILFPLSHFLLRIPPIFPLSESLCHTELAG